MLNVFKFLTLLFTLCTLLFLGSKEGGVIGRSLTLSFFLCSTAFFILFFRRIYVGFLSAALFCLAIFFISLGKYQNLGITLNLSDLYLYSLSQKETVKILFEYASAQLLLAIFGILIIWLLAIKFEKPWLELRNPKKILLWGATLGIVSALSLQLLKNYTNYLHGSTADLVNVNITQSPAVSGFVASLGIDGIKIPSYPKNLLNFKSLLQNQHDAKTLKKIVSPNIFVWLEESTFDPHMLKGCIFDQCNSSLFKQSSNKEFENAMRVHTWGGGTWTSEFSFLSGLDHRMFGPWGMAAPVTLAGRLNSSLPKYLSELGYETIAIFPITKAYLYSGSAYRSYGFNQIVDINDEGEDTHNWDTPDAKMLKIFEKVIDRQTTQKPLFVFMLTIYQHGPHQGKAKPFSADYQMQNFKDYNASMNEGLNHYLDRLHLSEVAATEAEHYLSNKFSNQKWIFTHFGDHLPNLGESFLSNEERQTQYITYFKMKANFKLSVDHFKEIDLSYLGNYILTAAALPLNAFYAANQALLNSCLGSYLECKNRSVWEAYNNYVFNSLNVIQKKTDL